jgi:hypothetical protein
MNFDYKIETLYRFFFKVSYALIYNAMYAFSLCQIKYNGFVKIVSPSADSLTDTKVPLLEFIREGTKVDLLTFLQSGSGELRMDDSTRLIYSVTNNGIRDISMLQNGDKVRSELESTDYSFISIDLVFDDDVIQTSHKIQLKVGDENYYVVGNVIDAGFITYYAHKYLNLQSPSRKYTLNVVDGDVNCFSMTQDDRMLLGKTEYTLLNEEGKPYNI